MKNKNKIIGAIVAVVVIAVGYAIFSGQGTLFTGKITTLRPSRTCPDLPPLPVTLTIPLPPPEPQPPITTGPLSVTLAPTSPSSTLFGGTNLAVPLAHFRLTETSGAEGVKITSVVITNVSIAATSFYSVGIFDLDTGEQLGGYQNFGGATNGTAKFSGLNYVVPAGQAKTLVVKASPVAYPSGTSNSDHTIRIGAGHITAHGVVSGDAISAPASGVNSNTHTWARTSLAVTGGRVTGDCTINCIRGSADEILTLSFTSGSPYGATFRSCTNDSITVNFSGSLGEISTITGLPVELVDTSDSVRAIGYVESISAGVAKAVLRRSATSDIVFTTLPMRYKIRVDTSSLMAPDTVAGETLSVSVSLGGPTSNGNIRWYDGALDSASSLTWVSGTSPITAKYLY